MSHFEYELLIVGLVVVSAVGALGAFVWGFRPRRDRGMRPESAAPAPADVRGGLRRTREALVARLDGLLRGKDALDRDTLDEIERLLFGADLGVRTAELLLEAVRAAGSPAKVHEALRVGALEILRAATPSPRPSGHPHVVLVVGVNGSGKTTSIGKLAARYARQGKRVLLAAADTFRAAAIEQLGIWAERAGAELVRGQPGGDAAAVAYDAVRAAQARGLDVVIVDTAGRLQTEAGLMDELGKISRVVKKEIPDAPHEVVLVLDANTGQNAIRQAQEFGRAVEVDRILLAKLDGTAKGGVVLGIAREVGIPVSYLGVGEGIDDLCDFDAESFVGALFERAESDAGAAARLPAA